MAIISAILAVDFPVGPEFPALSLPALAGDTITLNDVIYQNELPTAYKLRPGPLSQGRFVIDGAPSAGDYTIKSVRFTQNGSQGKLVDLQITIPFVVAHSPQANVISVDGTGGSLQVINNSNATVYYAFTIDGHSYPDVERLIAAAGALQKGSSPVLAGQTYTFPKFSNGAFNTTYRLWYGSRNDGIDSEAEFLTFTTTSGGTLPDNLPLVEDGEELVVTIF